ncbi:MAG: glycosyltransferase family protein [Sphingomonadales bacterium]
MTVLGILQARVSSSRLPGKALKPLLGQPMLARQIERLRRVKAWSKLVVATSTDAADDAIADLCRTLDIGCHRGPLDDVLARFWQAARAERAQHVVRLTGDCPLADPALIDRVIACHLASGADYTSNCLIPSYPDGLDVEAMRWPTLDAAHHEAVSVAEREHVTLFIRRRRDRFVCENIAASEDLSALRWTVDEAEDLALVEAIYAALYPRNPAFATADILAWLARHPAWRTYNVRHRRNAGLDRALAAEAAQGRH